MSFEEISVEEAHRRRDEFHAIDVRADHEFRGPLGRLRNSILVPLPELDARVKELPVGRPLLLICRSGVRSGKACEKLGALGIKSVVNLAGGMIAWNQAKLPLERVDPASLTDLLDLVVRWVAQVSAQTPDAARELLGGRLESLGASLGSPTHAALDRLLDFIEESLTQKGAPPDLELSITSFRRSLATL